jgi:nitroreductase
MPKCVYELAKNRKSVRNFSSNRVNIDDVYRALEVAAQAPSGANRQPWRFIIISDPDLKRRVKDACEKGEKQFYDSVGGEFRGWLFSKGLSWRKPFLVEAPLLVAVFMDEKAPYAKESVWVSIGFLLLALEEQGLGTVTYTPSDTDLPSRELEVPEGYKLEAVLPIGHSADEKPRESRHRLEEMVFLNRWHTNEK